MKAKTIGFYLIRNLKLSKNKYARWKKIAKALNLSKEANQRLAWIIYYYTKANKNTSLTCRHFGIARSKWYFWFNRFDEENLRTLETNSTAPVKKRQKEYTPFQYEKVVKLRKDFIRYGKIKILDRYEKMYPNDKDISLWKVQCIIQDSGIYYNPKKTEKTANKRNSSQKKKRITELKTKPKTGYLLCLDTIIKNINGQRRYILTAIDKYSKIAYARMYSSHSSQCSEDFILRLNYLLKGKIENIQTDNGSEFGKYFNQACKKLNLDRYYSRVRTPKDNAICERFNRTLKEEFIQLGNYSSNMEIFNKDLTQWLIEYNFHRPHQTLEYMTPIGFNQKYSKVSKKYSSNTFPCAKYTFLLK
jgi:transposase InsO family protein